VPEDGTPESVRIFIPLVPDALEFIEVVLDQAIKGGGLGISGPVDSLG